MTSRGIGFIIARAVAARPRAPVARVGASRVRRARRVASIARRDDARDATRARARSFTLLVERSPSVDVVHQRAALDACDAIVHPDFGDDDPSDARGEDGARASVRSVSGARCRDAAAARARISRAVARRRDEGGGGRFALLCVSGDGDRGGGMTSEDVLREARGMRARGEVPRETTLLAAVNPMLGASEAVRMLRKRECGADGFISQPALLQNRFEAWREACERSGALDGLDGGGDGALAGLFLGVSTARTAKSLEFWYKLTGVDVEDADARALRDEYVERARTMTRERFDDWTFERVELAAVHAISFARASGLHVMPVTAGGYEHAARLARDVLPAFRQTS